MGKEPIKGRSKPHCESSLISMATPHVPSCGSFPIIKCTMTDNGRHEAINGEEIVRTVSKIEPFYETHGQRFVVSCLKKNRGDTGVWR